MLQQNDQDSARGNTGNSAFIYFNLHLLPTALNNYFVVSVGYQKMVYSQPMYKKSKAF